MGELNPFNRKSQEKGVKVHKARTPNTTSTKKKKKGRSRGEGKEEDAKQTQK